MNKIHKFEQAGLGKSPFFVKSYYLSEEFDTCEYCGQAIKNIFFIKSADNKSFKVGCECVKKTGDAGLTRQVDERIKQAKKEEQERKWQEMAEKNNEMIRKMNEEKEKEENEINKRFERAKSNLEKAKPELDKYPHPLTEIKGWYKSKTLYDDLKYRISDAYYYHFSLGDKILFSEEVEKALKKI